jgi:thiol-disulfide isomerase/thioredoxin
MKKHLILIAALSITTALANASDLLPGSPAPKVAVKKWVKGKPLTAFQKGKTYVVEFWATWCGPCIASIPHLTEVAKKNKDVQFSGISVWEENKSQEVEKFVTKMGDKMDYTVAYGGNRDGMADTWMKASGSNGIPTAFIVKDMKVMWIGHPMEIEEPLKKVKSGKFDVKKARVEYLKVIEESKAQMASYRELSAIEKLHDEGKQDEAKMRLDAFSKKYPQMSSEVSRYRFLWLATEDVVAWEAKAKEMAMEGGPQNTATLYQCGVSYASNPKKDQALAKKIADLMFTNADGNDALSFYYSASLYNLIKDKDSAVKSIDKAIEALPKSIYKGSTQMMELFEGLKKEIS